MKIYGLTKEQLGAALEWANLFFEGNLDFNRGPDPLNKRGDAYRLTLRVYDSSGAGSRRAASGRRTISASYLAHYAFMAACYLRNPQAKIITAMNTYTDHHDFLEKADDLAFRNVGSIARPVAFGDL